MVLFHSIHFGDIFVWWCAVGFFLSKVKCVAAQKTLGNTGLNNQHCVLKGE